MCNDGAVYSTPLFTGDPLGTNALFVKMLDFSAIKWYNK